MDRIHALIRRIERHAKSRGITPAQVVRKATQNPRLLERLKSRAARLEADVVRIEEYLDNFAGADRHSCVSGHTAQQRLVPEGAPDDAKETALGVTS